MTKEIRFSDNTLFFANNCVSSVVIKPLCLSLNKYWGKFRKKCGGGDPHLSLFSVAQKFCEIQNLALKLITLVPTYKSSLVVMKLRINQQVNLHSLWEIFYTFTTKFHRVL